jgi:hypothetical protein
MKDTTLAAYLNCALSVAFTADVAYTYLRAFMFHSFHFSLPPLFQSISNYKAGHVLYTEARSFNHCCSGKAIGITHFVCVFVALGTKHAMRMRHIVICGLPGCFHIIS